MVWRTTCRGASHRRRHRKWNRRPCASPYLRALLYYKEGNRHRAWPVAGLRHRPEALRVDTRSQPDISGISRHGFCRVPARVPGHGGDPSRLTDPLDQSSLVLLYSDFGTPRLVTATTYNQAGISRIRRVG